MIAFFARHPTAANLLMVILLVTGLLAVPDIRRETFPDFKAQEMEVRVTYPGATAETVDEAVCGRIEDALDSVRGVAEVRSEALESVGTVVVEMNDGGDFSTFKDEIDSAIAAIDDFPDGTEPPVLTELGRTDVVLTLLVTGPMDSPSLKAYCDQLRDGLRALDGVSQVSVSGFSDHQLRIDLDREALERFGLTVQDVAAVVGAQSVDAPTGTLESPRDELVLRVVEQRRTPGELLDVVIRGAQGGSDVLLRDVARVEDAFENAHSSVMRSGRRAGVLRVEKTKDQDLIRVAEIAKAFVERERERQPQVDIFVSQDGSVLVQDRLQLLVKNGWQGMLLVFLVMWAFFNVRLSFWVVMSLPVSFIGALWFLPQLGLTINMLTMVGMLLALGLLMDDGIVIAENIATHRARGKSGLRAAIDGIDEVKTGVLSSFLTTICVLGPLATLSGDIGKVLEVVPMMLILVLAVSLIEAFCILPAHLAHSMEHAGTSARAPPPSSVRRRFEAGIEWVRERVVGRTVDRLLRWRHAWVGLVVMTFLVAVSLLVSGSVPFTAFPAMDGDTVEARILLPQGTPLERTQEVAARVTSALDRVNERFRARQPEDRDLVLASYVQFDRNADAFERGSHVATVTADLLSAEVRDAALDEVLAAWREETGSPPDALSIVFTEPGFGPAGRAFEIRLRGADLRALGAAADDVAAHLGSYAGVLNVATDLRPGKREIRMRLRDGALGLGLTASDVAAQLRAAFHGAPVDEIQVGSESYEIEARLALADRDGPADLDSFRLRLEDGRFVPLGAVVEMRTDRGWSRIARIDGLRTVTVRGDIDARVANTAAVTAALRRDLLDDFEDSGRYPGVAVSLAGEAAESAATQASMKNAALVGLIGVFVILSFQFRSYVEPLVVMMAIPFALIGVIGGHWLMGIDMSMPSMLGFVSLAGIVVNDSILLVQFLKKRLAEGGDVIAAAGRASRERFRAVTITSLNTIVGLLPLLFEKSLQAQILIPLAVSVTFGLMASTVLVLLVIPALYVLLDDLGLARRVAPAGAD